MALSTRTQIEQKLKKEKRFDKIVGRQDVTEGLTESQVNALIAQYLIDNPVGGASLHRVVERVNTTIASGVTGTIFTSPPLTTGQVIRIYQLTANATAPQSGISLVIDGNTVFSEQNLIDVTPTPGDWGVTSAGSTSVALERTIFPELCCKTFSLVKNAGNTTLGIRLGYDIMEPIE